MMKLVYESNYEVDIIKSHIISRQNLVTMSFSFCNNHLWLVNIKFPFEIAAFRVTSSK